MGFRTHYSEVELLAYLDGELSLGRRLLAAQHLRRCWACRQRAAELERDIESVTRGLSQSWSLAPGATSRAKQQFRRRRSGYESARTPRQAWIRHKAIAAVVAGLAVIALSAAFWPRSADRGALPEAASLLSRAASRPPLAGLEPAGGIVSQNFEVTFSENPPGGLKRRARLELHFARDAARASARWIEGNGHVRLSALYDRQSVSVRDGSGVIRRASLSSSAGADLAGLMAEGRDLAQLEAAFGRWLEQKCWEPVSLAADFAQFASRGGARLTVARQRDGAMVLSSSWTRSGERYEATLELDPASLAVRHSQVRLWRGNRCVEISLRPEPVRLIPAALARPDLFELPGLVRGGVAKAPAPEAAEALKAASPAVQLDPQLVWEQEVAIHAALHEAGLCGPDPVEVKASRTGITVTGVVQDEARLRRTMAAIRATNPPPWVGVSLQTVAEAIAEQRATPAAGVETTQAIQAAPGRIRANDLLADYFRAKGAGGRETLEQQVSEFARQSVEASELALLEAWSYQQHWRVSEKAGDWTPSARAYSQLERMMSDHLKRAARAAGANLELLRPLLQQLRPGPAVTPPASASVSPADLPRKADQAHRLALALFAAGASPAAEAGSEAESLSRFEAELRSLQSECGALERRAAQWRGPR